MRKNIYLSVTHSKKIYYNDIVPRQHKEKKTF